MVEQSAELSPQKTSVDTSSHRWALYVGGKDVRGKTKFTSVWIDLGIYPDQKERRMQEAQKIYGDGYWSNPAIGWVPTSFTSSDPHARTFFSLALKFWEHLRKEEFNQIIVT